VPAPAVPPVPDTVPPVPFPVVPPVLDEPLLEPQPATTSTKIAIQFLM
jgi:hypothetical protein